jgi:hypothetical protein
LWPADQERAGYPIDAIDRNAENHGEKIFERSPARGRRPAQNNVALCPRMNAAAVCTG